MPIPVKKSIVGDAAFAENQTTNFRLSRGQPHTLAFLAVSGTITLTGAGTAVRARGVPIKSVQLVGDGGVTPIAMRGADLLHKAELYGNVPLASMYTAPANFTVAAHTFSALIPIYFSEPKSGEVDGAQLYTSLPSWAYPGDMIVRVQWGDETDMFEGTPAGTFSNVSVGLKLFSLDKLPPEAARPDFASRFWQVYESYAEYPVTAGGAYRIDVPRTEDVRGIMLVALNSSGTPANTVAPTVTLQENNTTNRVDNYTWAELQADTARVFRQAAPPGVAVIDFAEDEDISSILPASKLDSLVLFGTATAAGTLRVVTRRLGGRKY